MNTFLKKSDYIQMVSYSEQIVIWHSLFGRPKVVTKGVLEVLDVFLLPMTLEQFFEDYEMEESERIIIQQFANDFFLVPVDFDERNLLNMKKGEILNGFNEGSKITFLELIITESCNFHCTYCIHFNNLETTDRHLRSARKIMRFETAKEAVDNFFMILRVNRKNSAVVNFGGGEPLLGWPVIEKVIEYCLSSYSSEFSIKFSLNTNASLITDSIARKIKQFGMSVASSLDGLQLSNDKVRVTKKGRGTFKSIIAGFECLENIDYPIDGFAVTVDEKNFDDIDETLIDWAASKEMKEVRIDIDVITALDLQMDVVINKLIALRQYAKNFGIEVFGFWSRPAENLNESLLDGVHIAFCGAVRGNSICVNPSGIIYACGYSSVSLGKISDMKELLMRDSKYEQLIERRLPGGMEMCKGCMIEGHCGGGCEITQEFSRTDNAEKVERMCSFYRKMTKILLLEQLQEIPI